MVELVNPLKNQSYMGNVTYDNLKTNRQFLTSFEWDVDIVSFPKALFSPQDYNSFRKMFQTRIKEVKLGDEALAELLKVEHRMFNFYQNGATNNKMDGVEFTFTDWEDQTITSFLQFYSQAMSDARTKIGYRMEDLQISIDVYTLNANRKPTKVVKLFNGLPAKFSIPNGKESEQKTLHEVSMTIDFPHFEPSYLNI